MAIPIWAMMAMAGAAKGVSDKQQEKRDRHAAAVTQLNQPFTGMQPGAITKGDILGSTAQGGLAGYGMQQNMDQNEMFQDMMMKQQMGQNVAGGQRRMGGWGDMGNTYGRTV